MNVPIQNKIVYYIMCLKLFIFKYKDLKYNFAKLPIHDYYEKFDLEIILQGENSNCNNTVSYKGETDMKKTLK